MAREAGSDARAGTDAPVVARIAAVFDGAATKPAFPVARSASTTPF
jgi:hypothetical protein